MVLLCIITVESPRLTLLEVVVTVRVTLQEVINAPTAVINDTTNKVNKNRFIESHLVKNYPKLSQNYGGFV